MTSSIQSMLFMHSYVVLLTSQIPQNCDNGIKELESRTIVES